MINRQLFAWLNKVKDTPQIVHLYGMRQTGKTTLMNEFRRNIPGHLHYPLQNYPILNRYQGDVNRWVFEIEEAISRINDAGMLHVFVDEVQKIPDLFQAIQGLYDTYKGRLKFWIWGSSARPLKKKRAETLAGRFISRTLFPLSQGEILCRKSIIPEIFSLNGDPSRIDFTYPPSYHEFLRTCFRQSMLPEAFTCTDTSMVDDLLEAYQASYIENEIRRENLAADIGVFSRFMRIAASENTTVVNYSSIAKDLGVSSNTIKTYYDILHDTFVILPVHASSSRLRVQVCKSPKMYFTDTGLARFIAGERGLPADESRTFGLLFEGFVISEFFKQSEYCHVPWELSFVRTKSGKEADLIVSDGERKCAIEIKSSPRVGRPECAHLEYLMANDPTITCGAVVSLQGAPIRITDRIINIPAWNL